MNNYKYSDQPNLKENAEVTDKSLLKEQFY
jgi:hypothetical protein